MPDGMFTNTITTKTETRPLYEPTIPRAYRVHMRGRNKAARARLRTVHRSRDGERDYMRCVIEQLVAELEQPSDMRDGLIRIGKRLLEEANDGRDE